MRTSVHDDVALPPLALIQVVEHRDAAGRLHDPAIAPAEQAAEVGQAAMQAAVRQPVVLRPIAAIETLEVAGVVARRRFREPRRGRWIILASGTDRRLALARVRRLQQSEAKFAIGRLCALRRRGLRRNPAVGRIDDQRRMHADVLDGQEHRVVGAADVERGPALLPRVAAEMRGALLVDLFPLLGGVEFLVRVPGGALQGRIEFVGPDSLQVGLSPRRLQRRPGSRRRLRRGPGDRSRNGGADRGRRNGDH
jgi:hypothetical protein